MTLILIASIAIRLAALAWSVVLLHRQRDWRMLLLTATLGLMALRQLLTLRELGEGAARASALVELPGLAVSLLAFLFVIVLDGLLAKTRLHDTLIESAVDAVVRVSPAHELTFVNPAFETLTGWPSEESLGRPLADLVHPDDRDEADGLLDKVLQGTVLPRPELRLVTKDGDTLVGEFALAPELEAGRVTGVLGIARDITEPKRAEDRLRRLEKRYRYVFRDAPEMYVLALVQGKELVIEDCNDTFLRKLGFGRDEVLGRDITSFYTLESRADLLGNTDFADTAAGRTMAYERQLLTKSGEIVETLLRTRPERDDDGAVVGTLAMFIDVTAGKRAARDRDEALAKFESIARHVPDCFWSTVMEPDGSPKVTYVSPGWRAIWGYEPEDIYENADLWLDCVVPEDHDIAEQAFENAAVKATTQTAVYRVRAKSGDLRWVEDEMSPILDKENRVIGLDGIARDITARKEAEETIRRSAEQYRELFEDSLDVVFISAPEGKLIAINRSGLELFGYESAAEIQDVSVLYADPADREHYLERVSERGHLKDYELRLKKKDGTPLTVLETLRAIREPSGQIVALQGIMRDVTEQRALQVQLAQSQRMEATGRLAGGVAHDFNNLLTAIIGYLRLAVGKLEAGRAAGKELDEVDRAAHRAAALVQQLLAFSRQQVMEPRVLDLNEIVEGLRELLERMLRENFALEVRLGEEPMCIEADPTQMEQVLMNLVVNAREASPSGGRITISTSKETVDEARRGPYPNLLPGSYVVLTVADSGEGMNAETLAHMFEPFFTTKSGSDRTGLGLSTTYGIIEQSGGHILPESQSGGGSTFRVYLPWTEKIVEAEVKSSPHAVPTGGSETILVVEDEDRLLNLVEAILTRKGYNVLTAARADQALEVLAKHDGPVDLLLADLVLPDASGLKLVESASTLRDDTKVLAMSGYSGPVDPPRDLDLAFIAKPFTPEELAVKVREVLDAG